MRFPKKDILTIPNAASFSRLIWIPLIAWAYLVKQNVLLTAALLVISWGLAAAAGRIAVRFHRVSDFVKMFGFVADQLTQLSLIACFSVENRPLIFLTMLIAVRDIMLLFWTVLATRYDKSVNSAQWHGTVCTAVVYSVSAITILFPEIPQICLYVLFSLCGFCVAGSLILYGGAFRCLFLRIAEPEKRKLAISAFGKSIIVAIWLLIIFVALSQKDRICVENLTDLSANGYAVSSIVMLALFALKGISLVLYCGILYTAVGLLFPIWIAIPVNVAGTALMVTLPYWLGRKTGGNSAPKRKGLLRKLLLLQNVCRDKGDFVFVFFTRLLGLPSDLVSVYMGGNRVSYAMFLWASILGLLPELLIFTVLGQSADDIASPGFLISLGCKCLMLVCSVIWFSRMLKRTNNAQRKEPNPSKER